MRQATRPERRRHHSTAPQRPARVPAAVDATQAAVGASTVSTPVAAAPDAAPPSQFPIRTSSHRLTAAGRDADRDAGSFRRESGRSPDYRRSPPVPLASPAPTATSDAAGTAKASRDGAPASAPAAGGVTEPDLGVSSAATVSSPVAAAPLRRNFPIPIRSRPSHRRRTRRRS